MNFLPVLRRRETRPVLRTQLPPQLPPQTNPGLNADYYNATIPFGPAPASPAPHRPRNSLRRRHRPSSPHVQHHHPARASRGQRRPPAGPIAPDAPIFFAPDPPTPEPLAHHAPPMNDRDMNGDARGDHGRRLREHKAHVADERHSRDHQPHREPQQHRHRPSRREPTPERDSHPRHRSSAPRDLPESHRPQDWQVARHRPSHRARLPSPSPPPAHRSRHDHDGYDNGRHHRRDSSRPREPLRGHAGHGRGHDTPPPRPHAHHRSTLPPPASSPATALQRAFSSEWWRHPAVQAGAHAVMRHRRDEGPWLGPKGAKVAGAAMSAAMADGTGGRR